MHKEVLKQGVSANFFIELNSIWCVNLKTTKEKLNFTRQRDEEIMWSATKDDSEKKRTRYTFRWNKTWICM